MKVTEEDIQDLLEFALNAQKPNIKTKRTASDLTITVNRSKFKIKVERKRKLKAEKL